MIGTHWLAGDDTVAAVAMLPPRHSAAEKAAVGENLRRIF